MYAIVSDLSGMSLLISGMSSSLTSDSSKCDSMAMFIRLLQKFAEDNGLNDTTIYIVSYSNSGLCPVCVVSC